MAAGCVVSSLHDGMNLVAKEFVAARSDLRGVLVLSRFTGAAEELSDALQFNPYGIDEFAETLHRALTMPVEDNNVYRWAGMLLSEAGKLVQWMPREGAHPANGEDEQIVVAGRRLEPVLSH
jgi:trehalose 6-phosphate synthase